MATTDLSPIAGKTVRTPDGKNYRIPSGATKDQVSQFFASRKPAAAAPPTTPPVTGVVGGSSTALDPRRAIAEARSQPINPYSQREQPSAPQAANPIVRGFTGTIYGGNVAGAGGTIEAAGAATGIRPVEAAGRALRQHGERFTAPPPPDIFQIAPDDPAGRQKVLDYLGYVTGAGIASSAPSVVGGVVGGIAGAPGGPAGVTAGSVAGAAIPAYLMNTGGVYQEIEKIGGGSPAGRARIALVIGLPVTALDVFSAVKFSGKLTRFMLHQAAKDAARPLAARVAVGGLKGAVTEGGTEGAQRVVQDVGIAAGTKKEFDVGETARGAAGDFIGGALTGGVLGGATSIPQRTDGGGGGTPDARSQARAARRVAAKPLPAEEAQALAVRPPPLPVEDAVLPRVPESVPAPEPKPAPTAGAPTAIQSRIAALETQVRKRPNEPKLVRRLEALKAEHQAKVGPENEAHEALQAKIASAPKRIAALEKQIAETPNDKRAGKWKARVEELKALVETGRPKAKGAAGEAGAEPAPAKQTTAPVPAVSSPPKVASQEPKAPSGKKLASPAPKAGVAAPVNTRGVEGSAAALPAAPARMMVPGFQFGDEATAQRVADGIRTPGADPKVVKTKKGFEIEVNEGAGASRLKKQSFVKVAPKNPAPDVAAAAEAAAVPPGGEKPASPVVEKPAQPALAVGQRVVHQPSITAGDVVSVSGNRVVVRADDGREIAGKAGEFRAVPAASAPAARRNLPKVPAKGEELARQGKPLEEAEAQANARPVGDPPAGPGLKAPRETSGTRNYQPGETMLVPYSGRSKKLTNERAVFRGYTDVGGVPHVTVTIQRGKGVETRTIPESQVRRRPKPDRRGAEARSPRLADKLRKEVGGDVEKAREMANRALEAADRAMDAANAASPDERRKLLGMATKARDAHAIAERLLNELEPQFDWADPSVVDAAMKEWLADPERGAINITDLRAALIKAMKRLSGMARRDPALKAAAKVKRQPPPVVAKMLKAIKQAAPVREQQEALNVKERAHRAKLAKERRGGKYGVEELRALTSAHAGEFPNVDFESIARAFSPDEIDQLTHLIVRHPALDQFEQMRAGVALQKLFGEAGGEVPQRNELELLEIVFGPEFVEAMMKIRPELIGWKEAALAVIDVSRALRTSFDLSNPMRQGLFLAPSYPKEWAQAFVDQHKYWASEESFDQAREEMQRHPRFKYARRGGLAITRAASQSFLTGSSQVGQEDAFFAAALAENLHKILPDVADRLEKSGRAGAGLARVAGKIVNRPLRIVSSGVRRSERGYVGFANRFRFDVFNRLFDAALAARRVRVSQAIKKGVRGEKLKRLMDRLDPRKNDKLLNEITGFVNAGTGRGDSKFIAKHAGLLNRIYWSAHLIQSRLHLLNPANYVLKEPFVRRQYWKAMAKFQGTALLMLTLASWAGATIEKNRRSGDFGKARVDGVVYDILGGFVQYVRFFPSVAEALWEEHVKHRKPKSNAWELVKRFNTQKVNSVPAYVMGYLSNHATERDEAGKRGPFKIAPETLKLFVSMSSVDIYEVMKKDPRQIIPATVGSIYGVGVQVYDKPKLGGRRFPQPAAP